jgi:hypothetical protein
LATRTD